jgi:hypothetical protein
LKPRCRNFLLLNENTGMIGINDSIVASVFMVKNMYSSIMKGSFFHPNDCNKFTCYKTSKDCIPKVT